MTLYDKDHGSFPLDSLSTRQFYGHWEKRAD